MLMTVPVTIHIAAGLFWLTSMFASNVLKTGRHRLLVSDCITMKPSVAVDKVTMAPAVSG